jgi:hypothetical protein
MMTAVQTISLSNIPTNAARTLVLSIFAFGPVSTDLAKAQYADWKLHGATSASPHVVCFYDAKGVARPTEGQLRVWTKCIETTKLDNAGDERRKKLIESAADKVARGYVPPIVAAGKKEAGAITTIALMEEAANQADIQPLVKVSYEIDCERQIMRELSLHVSLDGTQGIRDKPTAWTYVLSQTNAETLFQILCHPHE